LPGTGASTAQRKPSGVNNGHRTQARGARAALDGENAVVRWGKQQDRHTPTPHQPQHQGLASGARRPSRAGGVKDQSRMAAIRQEARGAAREPDGGTPGRIDCLSL